MKKNCDFLKSCGEDSKELFTKNGFPILECKSCRNRYVSIPRSETHVEQVYTDDYFFKGKAGYPNYISEENVLIRSGKRYAKIISRYTQPGRILDVGCAAGFILKGFEKAGWDCYGVDPNDTMANYGRNQLQLKIQTGSMELFKSSEKFDLISMIQVVGHFYDIDKVLLNVSSQLKPKGLLLIESWNMNSLYARLMGSNWHEYSPPSVVRWFSDKSLISLLKDYNLEILDHGHPVKQIGLKHAFSLLEEVSFNFPYKKSLFHKMTNIFGNLTVTYPFDDLKWYVFQKS